MNILEPIKCACVFLNLNEELLELETFESELQNEQSVYPLCANEMVFEDLTTPQKNIYLMMKHATYAVDEIATDYLPLKFCEKVNSNADCQILFSAFTKPVRGIYEVNCDNEKCTFNDFATFLKVGKPNTEYEIVYAYYPQAPVNFKGEFETCYILPARVLAYKIASEFCLSKSLFDESVMWEKRFYESMNFLRNKLAERKLKQFPLY